MRILIIDCTNQMFRSYIVCPDVSSQGQPIGGLAGFLRILQKLCNDIKPDRTFLVWDCGNGSKKRKSIKIDYKQGRKPIRLNRFTTVLNEQEEQENRIWQQLKLIEYLNMSPLSQFFIDDVECDDVIAYLARMEQYQNDQKVIVSSDKDFIQLINNKTILYRPTQQEILNTSKVIEKYGIHPHNFALAKSIAGDKSDNIEGIPGAGFKTIVLRFPFLVESKYYKYSDICNYAQEQIINHKSKIKLYHLIVENCEKINYNFSLIQLTDSLLNFEEIEKVKYILENPKTSWNKTEFTKQMINDGFGHMNLEDLFCHFNRMIL